MKETNDMAMKTSFLMIACYPRLLDFMVYLHDRRY